MTEEARARNILYQQLTQVQHRDYAPMVNQFHTALREDPDFTARTLTYLALNSEIRDQQDAAIITLLQAPMPYSDYREAGRCLLLGRDVYDIEPNGIGGLPPFRIFRIEFFIRGAESTAKVPRLMKGAMTDYVRRLEQNDTRFDGVVMRNRKQLRSVYRHYHIAPSARAQATLFQDNPPADSKLAVLKQIADTSNIHDQVRLVIEHRIPYVVASSVLPKMSPAVAVALIDVMSPTEALNSRHWVEQSGILNIPEVREVYTTKVATATASVASAEHRVSAQGADAGVQAAVEKAKERSVAKQKRIEGATDIYLDHSYSMHAAIETAPRFAERIIPLCDDYAFYRHNDAARRVRVEDTGKPYQDVQRALRGIRAGGGTYHHSALEASLRDGRMPQRIILLTDGGENRGGRFARSLQRFEAQTHIVPQIVVLHFDGDPDLLTPSIERAGYQVEKFHFDGDYYILDQVAAVLGGPPAMSLVERIMQTELPRRV